MLHASITVGLRAITLASKFLLVLFMARYFAPRELGIYGVFSGAIAIVLVPLGLEFYAFSMRELVAATPERRAAMIRDQLAMHAIVYAVAVVLAAGVLVFGLLSPVWAIWFAILAILEHLSHEATRVLIALSRAISANIVLFVRTAAWVYLVLALAFTDPGTRQVGTIFAAWSVGALASLGLCAIIFARLPWRAALKADIDWKWIRTGLRTVRPFFLTAISATGLIYVDRFFLTRSAGLDIVGIYTFFFGITSSVQNLVNSGVSMTRIPRIISAWEKEGPEGLRREIRSMLRYNLATTIILAGLAAALIGPALAIVDKPAYRDHLWIYFILLLAAVARCLAEVPLYTLYARRQDRALAFANVTAFLAVISANVVLTPAFGGVGAALSSFCGALALGLLTTYVAWFRKTRTGGQTAPGN